MKKRFVLPCIVIFCITAAGGQSSSDEIARQQKIAEANEKLAKQAEARALKAENQAKMMRYLAIANELAERSIEIQEKDLSALMAVQAYNFNSQNNVNTYNNKIYNALIDALKKYDLIPKNASPDSETKSLLEKATPNSSARLTNNNMTVVAEQNGNLKIVNDAGLNVMTLSGHRAQVDHIKFSRSGKLMATSGKDNAIRIWNLEQLTVRPLVITESDPISKLTFSPDDTNIFYELGVKKVTICQRPLDMKLMAADLCNVLTRSFTAEEWKVFVASDLPYESTCSKK